MSNEKRCRGDAGKGNVHRQMNTARADKNWNFQAKCAQNYTINTRNLSLESTNSTYHYFNLSKVDNLLNSLIS